MIFAYKGLCCSQSKQAVKSIKAPPLFFIGGNYNLTFFRSVRNKGKLFNEA